MIRVDRSSVNAPRVLTEAGEKGPKECERAIAHFAPDESGAVPNAGKPFGKFAAYSEPAVRWALNRLFHGKCAYCESRYAGTQPMDVEHWRPKGAVTEPDADAHLGYYWLAAEWNNLLPSCADCNRARGQELLGEQGVRTVGKANRFPLAQGSERAHRPGEEGKEDPLLIDPCSDDPSQDPDLHLVFTEDGAVRPTSRRRQDGAHESSKLGRASIEVYALNRTGLAHERRERVLQIKQRTFAISVLARALSDCEDDAEERALYKDVLSHELLVLCRMRAPDQPYSALARQFIDPFIERLTGARPSQLPTRPR